MQQLQHHHKLTGKQLQSQDDSTRAVPRRPGAVGPVPHSPALAFHTWAYCPDFGQLCLMSAQRCQSRQLCSSIGGAPSAAVLCTLPSNRTMEGVLCHAEHAVQHQLSWTQSPLAQSFWHETKRQSWGLQTHCCPTHQWKPSFGYLNLQQNYMVHDVCACFVSGAFVQSQVRCSLINYLQCSKGYCAR